jgi:hypothetical protein
MYVYTYVCVCVFVLAPACTSISVRSGSDPVRSTVALDVAAGIFAPVLGTTVLPAHCGHVSANAVPTTQLAWNGFEERQKSWVRVSALRTAQGTANSTGHRRRALTPSISHRHTSGFVARAGSWQAAQTGGGTQEGSGYSSNSVKCWRERTAACWSFLIIPISIQRERGRARPMRKIAKERPKGRPRARRTWLGQPRTPGHLWCSSRRSTGVCVYPMLLLFAWPCASCIGRRAALMMPRLSLLRRPLNRARCCPMANRAGQGWSEYVKNGFVSLARRLNERGHHTVHLLLIITYGSPCALRCVNAHAHPSIAAHSLGFRV